MSSKSDIKGKGYQTDITFFQKSFLTTAKNTTIGIRKLNTELVTSELMLENVNKVRHSCSYNNL